MFIKSVVVAWEEEDKNWVHFDVGLHLGTSSMVCACVLKSCNVLFSAHLQRERLSTEQDRRKGIKKSAATHPSSRCNHLASDYIIPGTVLEKGRGGQ